MSSGSSPVGMSLSGNNTSSIDTPPPISASDHLEQMNIVANQEETTKSIDEDVEMSDVAEIKTSAVAKKDPIIVLKKLILKRDQYVSLYTDMIATDSSIQKDIDHAVEIREKIENLNKDISVLKNSIRLSNEKVSASVDMHIGKLNIGGLRLSKQDLPKFQLKSSTTKYFPKDESYESVNHFLRSFEKVISSSGEDVENIWKRYVPLTLPYELDNWLNNEVLSCNTWTEVGVIFNKKFGNNAILKLQARREVFNAKMRPGESTEEYTARFSKAVSDANYSMDNTTIGDAFLTGFPEEWQTQINTVLHCNHSDRDCWIIDEIYTAAINVYNSKPAPISFVNKSRTSPAGSVESNQNKKFKPNGIKETTGFYCSNHGGTASKHNEKDCYNNKVANAASPSGSTQKFIKPNFLGNKNVPRKATSNTFCKWCGVLWFFGHSCPEYEAKRNGNVAVLSVQSSNNSIKKKSKKSKGKQKADGNEKLLRECLEDDSY